MNSFFNIEVIEFANLSSSKSSPSNTDLSLMNRALCSEISRSLPTISTKKPNLSTNITQINLKLVQYFRVMLLYLQAISQSLGEKKRIRVLHKLSQLFRDISDLENNARNKEYGNFWMFHTILFFILGLVVVFFFFFYICQPVNC